jgi:hypothetical protein
MLEGKFAAPPPAAPARQGRFRFYVQRAVRNAALNHLRGRARQQNLLRRFWGALFPGRGERKAQQPATTPTEADLERTERDIWRATVLSRALEALEDYEKQHQERARANVYRTLAGFLADHPNDDSEQLAQRLGARPAAPSTPARCAASSCGCARSWPNWWSPRS